METVYRTDLLRSLSQEVGIPVNTIKDVFYAYNSVIEEDIIKTGVSRFLDVCFFQPQKDTIGLENYPSISYQIERVADFTGLSESIVRGIFFTFQDQIVYEIVQGRSVSVTSLMKIIPSSSGRPLFHKSTVFTSRGLNTRIFADPRFLKSIKTLQGK